MTNDEYKGIEDAQVAISRIASLLTIISGACDFDGLLVDSIDLCAAATRDIARKIDTIPGFSEAQRRRS